MHLSTVLGIMALCQFSLAAPPRLPFHHARHMVGRQNELNESSAPSCNLNNIAQPGNSLTPPTASMRLILVALGKGTQNYTCASPSSTPSAIGAVAQLFNASCALSSNPSTTTTDLDSMAQLASIGEHFFVDNTTPAFAILRLGNTQVKKAEEAPAPNAAQDVKWLRLQTQASGTTSEVKQVYRLNTVGGLAPATCEGKAVGETITVNYSAQYWLYA